jgi:hypothetical protein
MEHGKLRQVSIILMKHELPCGWVGDVTKHWKITQPLKSHRKLAVGGIQRQQQHFILGLVKAACTAGFLPDLPGLVAKLTGD